MYIYIDWILILKIIGLAFVIASFQPIGWLIDLMKDNLLKHSLKILTSCFSCVAFWTSIIMTREIFLSSFIYIGVRSLSNNDIYKYHFDIIKLKIKILYKNIKLNIYNKALSKILKDLDEESKNNE